MTAATLDDLRYPVGRFTMPATWTAADLARWRADLAELPERLRAAVAGLDDRQLDTPYREGGWTVRQTVHHIADSHLNAYCRIRLALTEDRPTIKPYDEARWAELVDARTLPIAVSFGIIDGIHLRLLTLIDTFSDAEWGRLFVHPERGATMSVAQTVALYAWHSRHHVAHITGLRTRHSW